jgi:hypothetical protein
MKLHAPIPQIKTAKYRSGGLVFRVLSYR